MKLTRLHRGYAYLQTILCGRCVVDENSFAHRQKPECHEVMRVCGRVVEKTKNFFLYLRLADGKFDSVIIPCFCCRCL